MRNLWSAAVAVSLLVAPSFAQRGGGHNGLPILAPPSPHNGFAPGSGHHRPFPASFYLGTPLWAEDFYSHNDQPPQVYVIEAPSAVQQKTAFEEPKPVVPVMIELQGDRYVRHATGETSNPQPNAVSSSPATATSSLASKARIAPAASAPVEEPAAVFVFRDGHREESSDYSIISGVIYSRGDYWSSGSWSKKILLADLDVPATLQANRERGVHFRLPSAANEVITRP
jgi:hypothetical protein